MTNQHPITPPSELVEQWTDMLSHRSDHAVFSFAAQWGADQELEACCTEVLWQEGNALAAKLRAARRPKPPTLKEQALEALKYIECEYVIGVTTSTIRRALEALPND
jgi:hypothetical protein